MSQVYLYTGADLGFSRGGRGRIFRKFRKFCRPFFLRSTKLIFWALVNLYKDPILTKFSAPQAKFWKKTGQKRRFRTIFGKCWQKNCVFSAHNPLSKFLYIGAKSAFRNFLGRHQKLISQKSTKGGPFGSAGGQIPEKGRPLPPPPP